MPPSPSKTLSPAELAKLEHAFATDPASESYKPLAEAYLSMGRFMEAMVVCKKGVKAHPTKADARVLLARVYAEQGKDKKALEELQGALSVAPTDKSALRLTGSIQLKNGEADAGRANLMKAYEQDPNDSDTLAALSQHNIQVAKPEPVIQMAAVPQPPVLQPAMGGNGAAPAAPQYVPQQPAQQVQAYPQQPVQQVQAYQGQQPTASQQAYVPQPPPQAMPQQPARVNGQHARAQQAPAPRPQQVRRPQIREYDEDAEPTSQETSISGQYPAARRGGGASKYFFLFLLVAGVVGLIGYFIYGRHHAYVVRESRKHLEAARKDLAHDSYDFYVKASDEADKALDLDSDNLDAHGIAAFAWTVRWGEHGGGDQAKRQAEEHIQAGEKISKSQGKDNSDLLAAKYLFEAYSGKLAQAKTELEGLVKDFEAQSKSSEQLYLTLGIIEMNAGDLQKAKEALDKAQKLAGSDPRVYAALANTFRRMGQDGQAEQELFYALRFERGHPESMLNAALLELDKDEPDYGKVKNILKTLLEQEPPPSPRQLAEAHMAKALMISRVSNELPSYKPEFQKQITDATGIGLDKAKNQAEITKEESAGMGLGAGDPELNLIKAKRLLFEKNYDAAATEVKAAISKDSTRAQFYVELAKALMMKPGGEKEALAAVDRAIGTMQDSPNLMEMRGDLLEKTGKLDEAIAQYSKLAEGKNKNPEARLKLGKAYREKKDLPKAIEQFTKASEEFIGNNEKVAETFGELGRAYEDKGDRAKAEDAYTKALNSDQNYPDPYYFYAHLKASAGDKKSLAQASELAKKYLELDPKGPYADDAKKFVR